MDLEEKRALFQELLKRLRHEHHTLLLAHKATQEGATHEEAKPENDKDTRALEQTYLARGQAERVAQLEEDVISIERMQVRLFESDSRVALGAIVEVDDGSQTQLFLLSPAGAGEVLESSRGSVKVVTPRSPLGNSLLGCQVEEDVEMRSPTGMRVLSIGAIF